MYQDGRKKEIAQAHFFFLHKIDSSWHVPKTFWDESFFCRRSTLFFLFRRLWWKFFLFFFSRIFLPVKFIQGTYLGWYWEWKKRIAPTFCTVFISSIHFRRPVVHCFLHCHTFLAAVLFLLLLLININAGMGETDTEGDEVYRSKRAADGEWTPARHFYQTCIIFFFFLLLNKEVAVHWLSCTFEWGQTSLPITHRLAYMSRLLWVGWWQRESDTLCYFSFCFHNLSLVDAALYFSKYKTVLSRNKFL